LCEGKTRDRRSAKKRSKPRINLDVLELICFLLI